MIKELIRLTFSINYRKDLNRNVSNLVTNEQISSLTISLRNNIVRDRSINNGPRIFVKKKLYFFTGKGGEMVEHVNASVSTILHCRYRNYRRRSSLRSCKSEYIELNIY